MAKKQQQAPKSLSNIIREYNIARLGMDMDSSAAQIAKGKLSYALNAVVENFDANSINYQNEPGNIFCLEFPENYILIGKYFINEQYKHIFFLTNPITGNSQIGYMVNNDCVYHTLVSDPCLGFSVNFPIHKVVHQINNCSTEIYWADNVARRYLDIDNLPYKLISGTAVCDPVYSDEIDCNQLKVQPNFTVPSLEVVDVITGGNLTSGTYQFAVQYADAVGEPLTSYYSITNPCPTNDPFIISPNYDMPVGKSIKVKVANLDLSGQFGYFNLAVLETVNSIVTPYLVGTYSLPGEEKEITYTGANKILKRLAIGDITEKFPYYDQADDVTTARDILIWKGLTSIDRINYQSIATQITLDWETHRIPATENYRDELNATNLRGYLRDEIYAFEIVFILINGRQTDGFHIPGRAKILGEEVEISTNNKDFIGEPERTVGTIGYSETWKIYNTATVTGDSIGKEDTPEYKGAYQYGKFAYWESEARYPCNKEVWGDLADTPIRHHKFPDVLVSPINESSEFDTSALMVMEDNAVFPIGVRIDLEQIKQLISSSSLTEEQKNEIAGIKIIRGNRATNKSIVAKGILRNLGKYEREDQEYYFPNYPYNDISKDPFLNKGNNAWGSQCASYEINVIEMTSEDEEGPYMEVEYKSCENAKTVTIKYRTVGIQEPLLCSIEKPEILSPGRSNDAYYRTLEAEYAHNPNMIAEPVIREDCIGTVSNTSYEIYLLNNYTSGTVWEADWEDPMLDGVATLDGALISTLTRKQVRVKVGTIPICVAEACDYSEIEWKKTILGPVNCFEEQPIEIETDEEPYRQVFNSPETSFGKPFLGTVLKLESVLFGKGNAHFTEVKDNAKYKLLTEEAQRIAKRGAETIGKLTDPFGGEAFFSAYESYLEIYLNGISRKNFAYSFNSIASYNYNTPVFNDGGKQRTLETSRYLIPGVQSIGDDSINNYNRESSVFLKTQPTVEALPFPKDSTSMIPYGVVDSSRFTLGERDKCAAPTGDEDIEVVSYYGSIKNPIVDQWGQVYSYTTVDTGFQKTINDTERYYTVFGGDTYINKFAFKTKLPLFIDNRVNGLDDSDIFYDEIGNVAYPRYWHSARSITEDIAVQEIGVIPNFISYKAHNFDCPNVQEMPEHFEDPDYVIKPEDISDDTMAYDGYFYLFAYGVPSFYCESSYNTDLRQAFNNREGEYWPHVSTGIPDEWIQESFVSIANDNTYTYNVTYSKQNKEDSFTHLPANWSEKMCYTHFPFRAIYSDVQSTDQDNRSNNWLIYRAVSYFDFPQNYGKFISIDGIADKAVLARFENKTLLYNNLLTIDTSNPQAAYIGNNRLFNEAPPIDFADTDLGFVGTQNKMLLKIPNGQITVDTKRGQIFLLNGTKLEVISKYGSGMNSFLKEHLPYKLLKYFPETKVTIDKEIITIPGVNVDNNFYGVGLHGVYDNRFDRVIITKLDYIPLSDDIELDPYTQEFSINGTKIELNDPTYFCNKSFTLSFNLNTKSWISFHSYIPNFYIAENNFFYSGLNECCSTFDFIAGGLVPTPSTTTTTTVYRPLCSPFMGTATLVVEYDCEPLSGSVTLTDCGLEGEGNVTVSPIPPPCTRPEGLITEYLIIGYEIDTEPYVDTSISEATACAGAAYIASLPNYQGITVSYTISQGTFILNSTVFAGNTTETCEVIADGWYYTEVTASIRNIFHVVNGFIIEIVQCEPTTTTTTTII